MQKTTLTYSKVPQFAKTDVAYAEQAPDLRSFFKYLPEMGAFEAIIETKSKENTPRTDLVAVLHDQYAHLPVNPYVQRQIAALESANTFTITTAHQPSLLLGPLYFIYKAITAINLAESVQAQTGKHILPVFVLGSEDHDLEELNHIHLFNRTLSWSPNETGAVGLMSTHTIQPLLEELKTIMGESEHAQYLFSRIQHAYQQSTFAEATQALLHDLFGRYGLVVLNMNDARLKRHFIPIMRTELLEQPSVGLVNASIEALGRLGYKSQASPREINLFYLQKGIRARIVEENGAFSVLNTDIRFSKEAILAELEMHPEHFSPNVVLRPLFQEIILPNLAYVGGGGELAYWLERQTQFEFFNINFPMLVRRNSVLWLDQDVTKKLEKLELSALDILMDSDLIVRRFVEKNTGDTIDLGNEIQDLHAIFDRLAFKAAATDPTLEKAVRAEEIKQVAALEQWQSRLLRSEKQKQEQSVKQIQNLKNKLCPENGLQERYDNFIPYYLKHGEYFLDALKENLQSFEPGMVVLSF